MRNLEEGRWELQGALRPEGRWVGRGTGRGRRDLRGGG